MEGQGMPGAGEIRALFIFFGANLRFGLWLTGAWWSRELHG